MKDQYAVLYRAALEAAQLMGPDLLKMSCFVSNWGDQHVVDSITNIRPLVDR